MITRRNQVRAIRPDVHARVMGALKRVKDREVEAARERGRALAQAASRKSEGSPWRAGRRTESA